MAYWLPISLLEVAVRCSPRIHVTPDLVSAAGQATVQFALREAPEYRDARELEECAHSVSRLGESLDTLQEMSHGGAPNAARCATELLPRALHAAAMAAETVEHRERYARTFKAFNEDNGFLGRYGEPVEMLLIEKIVCEVVPANCSNIRDFPARWCAANWSDAVAACGLNRAKSVLEDYCEDNFNAAGVWGPATRHSVLAYAPDDCVERILSWCR